MRLPNDQELRALKCVLQQISIHSSEHVNEPNTAACEGWLREFLDTVDACQEWLVDPDDDGACVEQCNAESQGCCTAAERSHDPIGEQRWPVSLTGPAPSWCPLREGVSMLVRRA